METDTRGYDAWVGRAAFDQAGDKLGKVESIYYDDETGRPEWVAVRTGLFGHRVTFAPLAGSAQHGDDLQLAYDKETVKDAPNCEADGHLSPDEERRLFRHYQVEWDNPKASRGDQDRADAAFDARRDGGAEGGGGESGGGDDAMTRSEEELRVGTERQATGRVRLRKYVVTEHRQVTVPVTREEVRVEREPITDDNVAEAMSGPEITDSEHEVVTHEERPVVSKQTVPKERVRLRKDSVTDQETVSREVRKEKIDVQGDVGSEKVADRREVDTDERPSEEQAAGSGAPARRSKSAGGVDASATKADLMQLARELDVSGRSKMSKQELVEAIDRANRNDPVGDR